MNQEDGQNSQQPPAQDEENRSKSRDPLVGTVLDGRFQIEEVLGSGGMSVVYKAKQLRVNRHVAIKTLRLQLDTKEIYRERFQREISSLCSLSHPNIVTVYDCIIGEDDQPYVVMDYLRGRSLEALIAHEGPMSVERFARISIQICSALEHAHKRGIIHRDLKPGNVVLMDDEMDFVKVVDFGLAKIGDQNKRLTHSGELWGSPPYMSPEQCMGEAQDLRSDIYSIGTVMYEMLCGVDPFPNASTVFEFIKLHTSVVPPSLNSVNPKVKVPAKVEAVVFKALEKDPNKRYQTAKELQEAIVEASAASVDREKGEMLLHLANQASSKTSSGQSAPGAEQSFDSGETPMTASQAFKRALNPFNDSMLSGSAPVGTSGEEPVGQSFTPSVQRWRHPDAGGEIVKPVGEVVQPVGEIVQPGTVAERSGADSGAPVRRPPLPSAGQSRGDTVAEKASNPFLLVALLVAVAFLIFVSVQKLLTPKPQPAIIEAPAVVSPVTTQSAGDDNSPPSTADTEDKPAVKTSGDLPAARPRKHTHSAARPQTPLRAIHHETQPRVVAPAAKTTAPPTQSGGKSDRWSDLDKLR